jgi:hypothetical protein
MHTRFRRSIRVLQAYAFGSTIILVFLVGAAFQPAAPQRPRFDELDVERLNIVEKDGRVRLVLANGERQTPVIVNGRNLTPGVKRPAGVIFFNDEGEESGGLVSGGASQNGVTAAAMSLSFNQYKQDQTVALRYSEGQGRRQAGLEVIDRPDGPLTNRQATLQRLFVGKDRDGNAKLVLSDSQARPRLTLSVGRDGDPRVEFLDAAGRVVRQLRP